MTREHSGPGPPGLLVPGHLPRPTLPEHPCLELHMARLSPPHLCPFYKATLSPETGSGIRASPSTSLLPESQSHPCTEGHCDLSISIYPPYPSFQMGHWSQNFTRICPGQRLPGASQQGPVCPFSVLGHCIPSPILALATVTFVFHSFIVYCIRR